MKLLDLQNLTRRYTNTTSTEYSDTDLNASLTNAAKFLATEILDSMDDWDSQGEISTTSLVADQEEYLFPSDILKIKRIEVSYDGTNWYRANFFDINQKAGAITSNETKNFSEQEPYVEIYEKSLFLYPTPEVAVEDGLKIWYSKDVVGLDEDGNDIDKFSAATDVPLLKSGFRKALVFSAATDYFTQYGNMEGANIMEQKLEKMISRIRTFYSRRIQDKIIVANSGSSLEMYE